MSPKHIDIRLVKYKESLLIPVKTQFEFKFVEWLSTSFGPKVVDVSPLKFIDIGLLILVEDFQLLLEIQMKLVESLSASCCPKRH
jgi:hypothetical protein